MNTTIPKYLLINGRLAKVKFERRSNLGKVCHGVMVYYETGKSPVTGPFTKRRQTILNNDVLLSDDEYLRHPHFKYLN